MALTLDSIAYGQLLSQFQPQPIETSEEYQSARFAILNFVKQGNLSPEQKTLIKLLTLLMREYDLRQPQPFPAKPHEILEHLIESNSISSEEIAIKLGDRSILSSILAGDVPITPPQAQILADTFKVSPSLFN
jgi:HTH-type transcriptional regulator / antitoxin HigA